MIDIDATSESTTPTRSRSRRAHLAQNTITDLQPAPTEAGDDIADTAAGMAGYPNVMISNGILSARVFLPDVRCGYYRGVRFDWAGVLRDLTYRGHRLFGPWKPDQDKRHNPFYFDDITGPAEEFSMHTPPGYDTAAVGEPFLKIGVGLLERRDARPYMFAHEYSIVNSGEWTVHAGRDWVEFNQLLEPSRAGRNFGYHYTKRLRFRSGSSQLVIYHRLENLGAAAIDTDMYCHNFINVDDLPIGPKYRISTPFPVSVAGWSGQALSANEEGLYFTDSVASGKSNFGELKGYGVAPDDHYFKLTHTQAGIGMAIAGTLPIDRLMLFATRETICPEPFAKIVVSSKSAVSWSTTYTLFDI